jgi:hypothetical protein
MFGRIIGHQSRMRGQQCLGLEPQGLKLVTIALIEGDELRDRSLHLGRQGRVDRHRTRGDQRR